MIQPKLELLERVGATVASDRAALSVSYVVGAVLRIIVQAVDKDGQEGCVP